MFLQCYCKVANSCFAMLLQSCKLNPNQNPNPNLTMTDGTTLATTTSEKDLGVYVDTKLTFEKHIETVVNQANIMLGLIRRSYTYLDSQSLLKLYTSLVRPTLEYCITLYFRGKKISRKWDLKYFREKIFSRIYCPRENNFPRKYLPAKITSRENIFSRKYLPAKISSCDFFCVPQRCRLVGLGYAV